MKKYCCYLILNLGSVLILSDPELRSPEFPNLYWTRFSNKEVVPFTVYAKTEDFFLRLFTPEEAPAPARTSVRHPAGDISKRVEGGALQIDLTFDFRQ